MNNPNLINIISKSIHYPLLERDEYLHRLAQELEAISRLKQLDNILLAHRVKEVVSTFHIPFFIRGSAGGSLLLYLLGFTNIDPIKHGILFERFINEYRTILGDIDFDLPKSMRDDIMKRVFSTFMKEGLKIGRLVTRVNYQKNSAIRETIRKLYHYHHTLPRGIMKNPSDLNFYLSERGMDYDKIVVKSENLCGKLRYSSAHVGGITILDKGEKWIDSKKEQTIPLVNLDRNDIDSQKRFKVDLLSNTGLDILNQVYPGCDLSEKTFPYLPKVFNLIGEGDIIGIVLGESPLIKSIFKIYHQKHGIKSIQDIAKCLSLIRPIGRGAGKGSDLIFDDDWIMELSKLLDVSYAEADMQRKKLAKDDPILIQKLKKMVTPLRLRQLMQIKQYGFCKAHATNYAQLIYCQAYAKWAKPTEFFCAVLNTLSDRMYEDWVYFMDALKKGVKIYAFQKRDTYIVKNNKKGEKWIQPKSGIQPRLFPLNVQQELAQFGGITSLKGLKKLELMACSRAYKNLVFKTVLRGIELVDEIEELMIF